MRNITLSIPDNIQVYEVLSVLKEKVDKNISIVEPELSLKTEMGNIKAKVYDFNKTIEITYEDNFKIAVVGFDEYSSSIFSETYVKCEEYANYDTSKDFVPDIENLLRLNKDTNHINFEHFDFSNKNLSSYKPNKTNYNIFQTIKDKSIAETILWEDDFSNHNFTDVWVYGTTFSENTILPDTFFADIHDNNAVGTDFPKQDFSKFEFPDKLKLYLSNFPLGAKLPEDTNFFNKLFSDNGFYFDLPMNVIKNIHYYNLNNINFDFSRGRNSTLISDVSISILSDKYKDQIEQGKIILPKRHI